VNQATVSERPIVSVTDLRFSYRRGGAATEALRGVSLDVHPGEAVGLVGESGSGKSTLARVLLGLTPAHLSRIEAGRVAIDGEDVTAFGPEQWRSLRGHPLAMMFQDPLTYLNPVMTVGRQVAESVRLHDRGVDVEARVRELLGLVRLDEGVAKAYAHELSGGMRQRALLAVALGCRPRLLVADEPTTALDVTTQAEIMALLADLRQRLGMAMLLISHDLGVVAEVTDDVAVMYAGRIVERGTAREIYANPRHPYTLGLLRSVPRLDEPRRAKLQPIPGQPPDLTRLPAGCAFAPRCGYAIERCRREAPGLEPVGPDHVAACWVARELEQAVSA